MLYILFAIAILSTSSAHLCLKHGISKMGEVNFSFPAIFSTIWQMFQNVWIIAGGSFFVIGFVIWIYALSKLQLNIAYPIFIGTQVVLVAVASWIFFHEYLSWLQILGIILVFSGIILISLK